MTRLLVLLLLAALALPLAATPARADIRPATDTYTPSRAAEIRVLAREMRLLNYYPRDDAWEYMWTRFDEATLARDFARIHHLGGNTVRLIVAPGAFGFPQPSAEQLEHLERTITLADRAGLRVFLTLYDYFWGYSQLEASRAWTTAVVGPYADDHRLAVVEVRNEIDLDDARAVRWARDQVTFLHELAPRVPVTLSLNGSIDPSSIATLRAALEPATLDLVSYHYFGNPGLAYDRFVRAAQAAAPLPLVIGEVGYSTAPRAGHCDDRACLESEQADWLKIVAAAAEQAHLGPPAPWTLNDFTPAALPRPFPDRELGFGLLRLDGSRKPGARVVADAFAHRLPIRVQNPRFRQTVLGGRRAPGWNPWLITGSFEVVPGQGVAGDPALAVSGTSTFSSGVSSWYAVPMKAVRPGQTWRARVQVRGVRATGTNRITLAWFDQEGRWIGNAESPRLDTAKAGWQQLTVTAPPPARARGLQIHLSSRGNSGTVYFSRVGWTVAAAS